MIIADGSERFRRSFHAVATQSTVHVKIDETRREVISVEIDNVFASCGGLVTNCSNFSSFSYNFEAIPNSVRENQTRVCQDHFIQCSMFRFWHSTTIEVNCVWSRQSRSSWNDEFRIRCRNHWRRVFGAATALMLKRQRPEARVLIIEKNAEFDGKSANRVPR